MCSFLPLYLAPLNVRVLFVYISGKAKVWDLHFSSFSYEDISCRKVPVNKLSGQNALFSHPFSDYTCGISAAYRKGLQAFHFKWSLNYSHQKHIWRQFNYQLLSIKHQLTFYSSVCLQLTLSGLISVQDLFQTSLSVFTHFDDYKNTQLIFLLFMLLLLFHRISTISNVWTAKFQLRERKVLIPSFQRGIACLWRSAMQRRSGRPWWVPCRLGSPGSWSFDWHPCPCSLGQLSDSRAGSCGVSHTWRTPRSDTMDLFREMPQLDAMRNRHALRREGRRTEVLPSWLHAPYIFMTCGWLTCFSKVNSDSRSRSSLWEAFSVMKEEKGM